MSMMPIPQRVFALREGAKLAKDGTFLNDTADVLEQVATEYAQLWKACGELIEAKDKTFAVEQMEAIMEKQMAPKLKVLPNPGTQN